MNYIVHYSIGSALFLGITTMYFFLTRRMPTSQNRLFSVMIVSGMLAVIFDALASTFDGMLPIWALYTFNMLFLLSMHICLPLFCSYLFISAGRYQSMGHLKRLLAALPFIVVLLLTLSAPLWKGGIFYMDQYGIYQKGATHSVLYFVAAIYLALLIFMTYRYRFVLRREIRVTVVTFMLLQLAAIGLQLTFPRYLLTTSSTALAITAMYFVMQSPAKNVDALTGAFNRVALMSLLKNAFDRGKDFTVILISIRSLDTISHAFGDTSTNTLLTMFARQLGRMFPRQYLVRPYVSEFMIIDIGVKPNADAIKETMEKLPTVWNIDKSEIELMCDVNAISGRDCSSDTQLINVIDSVIQRNVHLDEHAVNVLSAHECHAYERESMLSASIESIINEGMLAVDYEPIFNSNNTLCAFDTVVRITDERFSYASDDEIVHAAEQTGNIHALSEAVLRRVCDFINQTNLDEHGVSCVCMRLSIVQCMREGISALLSGIAHSCGVDTAKLCFRFNESSYASTYASILHNIEDLRDEGFVLMLDDYGAGYTNSGLLTMLPVTHVRLDKLLVSRALADEQHELLFEGMCDVISSLELISICDEIATKSEAELILRLGVAMRQGEYFRGFLSEEEAFKLLKSNKGLSS